MSRVTLDKCAAQKIGKFRSPHAELPDHPAAGFFLVLSMIRRQTFFVNVSKRMSLSTLIKSFLPAAKPTQSVRRFDGAAGGRRATGFGTQGPINAEVAIAGSRLRQRARYLASNNPWISNAINNWVGNLAGSGIVPTSAHDERKSIIASFNAWAEIADADERTDFWGFQAEITRSMVIDGECFVQWLSADDGAPELRIIPSELIDESMTLELGNGGYIVQGVEFDSDGKRIAYHVLPHKVTQWATYAAPIRVEASEIMHVMKPIAAGQVRGVSWLAPIILPASEFDQLCDALLVGVKIAAMHAGFLIDQNGTAGEAYDGTESGGILETGIEPGTLKRLPTGIDVKFNTPAQTSEIGAFLRLNLQQLAAGLGLPEHMLSGDLSNANYSSLRAGLLPFRQRVEQIQYGTIIPQFLNPVFKRVTTFNILSGALEIALDRQALTAEWLPPKPMQVDPKKDVEATVAELEAGLTSRRKAVAERGWNLDDLDAEIAAEKEPQL